MSDTHDTTEYQSLLGRLSPPKGSRKRKRIVGRGEGSGRGKTSGRGGKGQTARSGGYVRPGFEGGQMPLARRLPKTGFKSRNRKLYTEIDLATVQALGHDVIDLELLRSLGRVKRVDDGVAILGDGELTRAVTLRVQKISGPARAKVEKAGGRVEIIGVNGKPLPERKLRRRALKSKRRAERTAEAIKSRPVAQ